MVSGISARNSEPARVQKVSCTPLAYDRPKGVVNIHAFRSLQQKPGHGNRSQIFAVKSKDLQ